MESKLIERLQQKSVAARRLLSCTFELTSRCVFSCQMCGFSMSQEQCDRINHREIDIADWKNIALSLKEQGVLLITLTGGEPLLYPDFGELYLFLNKNGFRVSVKTNGFLVDRFKDLFEQYPPSKVFISVYGMSSETYRAVTGSSEGFERMMNAVSFFSNNRVPVQTAYVALKTNYKDKALYDQFLGTHPAGVIGGILTDIHPHVVDHAFSNAMAYKLSPVERVAWETTVPFEENAYEERIKVLLERRKAVPYSAVWSNHAVSEQRTKLCLSAQNSCFFGSDGKMRFCQVARFSSSEPLKVGVEKAWQQLKSSEEEHFVVPEKCRCCLISEHCVAYCPARGFVAKHDVTQLPDDACEYTILKCIHKGLL